MNIIKFLVLSIICFATFWATETLACFVHYLVLNGAGLVELKTHFSSQLGLSIAFSFIFSAISVAREKKKKDYREDN
jgi:hypothetical protein